MKAFITGIGGFAGQFLTRFLLSHGVEVSGALRPTGEALAPELKQVKTYTLDILDAAEVDRAMLAASPDLIFHLAAQANVPLAWQDPEDTYRINVIGQLHVLEAARKLPTMPRVLVISSNEVYGPPEGPHELPLRETNPMRPTNPYAVSKVTQDMMAYQYFKAFGMPVIRARPFNHIGPNQTDAYVAAAFARQVAEAEAGVREPVVRVGNLEALRDFSDVRDIVRGYYLAITKGVPGEAYNLGSGKAISIRSILDYFVSHSTIPISVEPDPARMRPVDVPCVYADCSKIRAATGWEPMIPLEQTLSDVLEYWRAQHAASPASPH